MKIVMESETGWHSDWQREEFLRICSKEELAEKSQDIEVTIPAKKVKRHGTTSI